MEKRIARKKSISTKERLKNEVMQKMTELDLWREDLETEIPTYWDNFNNYVIFNSKFFCDDSWSKAGSELWKCVAKVFPGKSIAWQGKIQNDNFRSPTARIVYGESPWVEYLDNSIHYTWNVNFTMFCTGNVSERHRVAKFDCKDKVVVDMFAGIGYFTLPYLVYAKAKKVLACEWNSVSVEALKQNLDKNKVAERCEIFEGDVRSKCPRGVADHVNLGLIPSCEEYWSTAADILKPSGGVLHVHGNITSFSKSKSANYVGQIQCEKCLHLFKTLPFELNKPQCRPTSTLLSDFKVISDTQQSKLDISCTDTTSVTWKNVEWLVWAIHVSHSFGEHLSTCTSAKWTIIPTFLHRVKAYAPHIDHLVLDVLCVNSNNVEK